MNVAEHLQKIADFYCPYKVGDVVKPKGCAHTDKDCRITMVYAKSEKNGQIEFNIRAVVLKKDGTDSQHAVSWQTWNDQALREAIKKIPD